MNNKFYVSLVQQIKNKLAGEQSTDETTEEDLDKEYIVPNRKDLRKMGYRNRRVRAYVRAPRKTGKLKWKRNDNGMDVFQPYDV